MNSFENMAMPIILTTVAAEAVIKKLKQNYGDIKLSEAEKYIPDVISEYVKEFFAGEGTLEREFSNKYYENQLKELEKEWNKLLEEQNG